MAKTADAQFLIRSLQSPKCSNPDGAPGSFWKTLLTDVEWERNSNEALSPHQDENRAPTRTRTRSKSFSFFP